MGHWGIEAWENDAAADWFSQLFDTCGIAEVIEDTLKQDAIENMDEIRAAVFVLLQLGRTYVWPVELLDHQFEIAICRLDEIITIVSERPETEELLVRMRADVDTLRSRLASRH